MIFTQADHGMRGHPFTTSGETHVLGGGCLQVKRGTVNAERLNEITNHRREIGQ